MFIEHQVYFQGRFPCAWENYLIFRDTEFLECTTLFSNKAHSIKGALHSKFHPSLTGPPSYMSQSPIGRELSYSGPAQSSPKHDSKSHSGRSTAYHTIPPNVVFGDEWFHQNSAHFRGDSGRYKASNDHHFDEYDNKDDYLDEKSYSSHSKSSTKSSIARSRQREYLKRNAPAKIRGNSTLKTTWDGLRSTFFPFRQDVESILRRLGMGYLLDYEVVTWYCKYGSKFPQIDEFWEKHKISTQQVKSLPTKDTEL